VADDLAQSLKIETNDDEVALLSNDEDDVLSIDEIDLEPQTVCLLVDPVAFFYWYLQLHLFVLTTHCPVTF
jgi:hypothetical protein